MAKVKYVLLLPLTYNDKSKVPKDVKKRIFDDLFRLAGGHDIAAVFPIAHGRHALLLGSRDR